MRQAFKVGIPVACSGFIAVALLLLLSSRVGHDLELASSIFLLVISSGILSWVILDLVELHQDARTTGSLGSKILTSIFSSLVNLAGFSLAFGYLTKAALFFNFLGVGAIASSLLLPKFVGGALEQHSTNERIKSPTQLWSSRLRIVNESAGSPHTNAEISRLIDEIRFQPSSIASTASFDDAIDEKISLIESAVSNGDEMSASQKIHELKVLLIERKEALMRARNRS